MKLPHLCRIVALMLSLLVGLATASPAQSQERMSDKDVEKMFDNLKSDANKFNSTFDSAVGKSTIRKTSQEKEAKTLVQSFGKQSEAALNKFKKDQHPENELSSLLSSGAKINELLDSTPMGDQANAAWSRVKLELSDIAKQFYKEFPPK